ncbi:hypothetical protein, partial [Muribacter muris]|uniref:hypothetical protein n=1 Tax=Muribacter muris TaxID=67855 RepID=UPI001883DB41|nr:hypothetical protein [Muribacter muris]
NGGILTSDAPKSANRFSTGTYGESHIKNHSELKTRNISVSGGTGGVNPMGTLMSLPGNRNEREQSTTYATVGGNIDMTIRDEAGQKAKTGKTVAETLSGLHRDVANANRKVSQADMSKVQELQAMAAVVADIVNNAEQIYTHSDRERIENAKLALGKEAERLRQAGVLPENFTKDAGYEAAAKALNTLQSDYDKGYGTGSAFKRGVSAASGILQGLVTGN